MFSILILYWRRNILSFKRLEYEVVKFRALLDQCDKTEVGLIPVDFPIMSCKNASVLLAYHLISIWPDIEVFGIGGEIDTNQSEGTLSHYWLEIEHFFIDITADQYNTLDEAILNDDFIKNRPFKPVSIGLKSYGLLYELFDISYRESYRKNFSEIKEESLKKIEVCYRQIVNKQ